jgi:hypothetical protein
MSKDTQRWLGAGLGFATAVVWTTVGAQAALSCLLAAAFCAAVLIAREGGAVTRAAKLAGATRRRLQAAIPAQAPPARPAPRRRPKAERPRRKPAQTRPAMPTQTPAPTPRPYDHDEQSGEHVYEVATYGW